MRISVSLFALALVPFGAVSDRISFSNPWFGISGDDSVLIAARLQKVPVLNAEKNCPRWLKALENLPTSAADHLGFSISGWQPFSKDDLDVIQHCDEFPCGVKLDGQEVKRMAQREEKDRQIEYQALIAQRVGEYQHADTRREYEFPGAPIDPWAKFAAFGFVSPISLPKGKVLFTRKLDFHSSEMRPIRQVIDRRVKISAKDNHGTLWLRDVYTDHYFDGWGEWVDLSCDPALGNLVLVHGLVLELDLFKKSDLLSQIARPKIRASVEKLAQSYLESAFGRLKTQFEEFK